MIHLKLLFAQVLSLDGILSFCCEAIRILIFRPYSAVVKCALFKKQWVKPTFLTRRLLLIKSVYLSPDEEILVLNYSIVVAVISFRTFNTVVYKTS